MAKSWICVNCSFSHKQGPDSKPTHIKRKTNEKNPFATRGRDKLAELLAQVEEKKKRILNSRSGTQEALVWFVYLDNNKLKAIIVPDQKGRKKKEKVSNNKDDIAVSSKANPESSTNDHKKKQPLKKIMSVKLNLQPSNGYLAATIILTLVILVLLKAHLQLASMS